MNTKVPWDENAEMVTEQILVLMRYMTFSFCSGLASILKHSGSQDQGMAAARCPNIGDHYLCTVLHMVDGSRVDQHAGLPPVSWHVK